MSEELKTTAISWALRQTVFPKKEDLVVKNYSIDLPPFGRRKLNTLFGSYNNFRREAGVEILQHDSKEEVSIDSLKRDCIINDEDCWIWQKATSEQGYAQKSILGKVWKVHRYVHQILATNPPPSSKHSVDHSCRNSTCINPDHLRWATASEQRLNQKTRTIYHPKQYIRPPAAKTLEECMNWYLQQSSTDDNGCMISLIRPSKQGYTRFGYASKAYSLHILSALQKYNLPLSETYYESFTKDNIVLHKCNNRACCNPDHLEIGTGKQGRSQNAIDARSYHSGVKLKDTDIPELREIYSDCLEMQWSKTNIYKHLGSIYAVSPITICNIINGRTWTDIK
jgi:hypothetical protein